MVAPAGLSTAESEQLTRKLRALNAQLEVADPLQLYKGVEDKLRAAFPASVGFYELFVKMVADVEGFAGMGESTFWTSRTRSVEHLARAVVEAATLDVERMPAADALVGAKEHLENWLHHQLGARHSATRLPPGSRDVRFGPDDRLVEAAAFRSLVYAALDHLNAEGGYEFELAGRAPSFEFPRGRTRDEVARELTERVWTALHVRRRDGALIRRPTMLSVEAYLSREFVQRTARELDAVSAQYAPGERKMGQHVLAMLQKVLQAGFFSSFQACLAYLAIPFNPLDDRTRRAVGSIEFAEYVGAHYNYNRVINNPIASGVKAEQAAAQANLKCDSARRALGISSPTVRASSVSSTALSDFFET